jgi:hypothetical protein
VDSFKKKWPQFDIAKLTSPGQRDWEDYLIVANEGRVGFIELKRLGKKPSERQEAKIAKHKALGHKAYWCDNAGDFMVYAKMIVEGA